MPGFVEFQPTPAPSLHETFPLASPDAVDLLTRMLCFDPAQRISAADALRHRYFRTDPEATAVEQLPQPRKIVEEAAGQRQEGRAKRGREESEDGAEKEPKSQRLASLFDDVR